jgi:hypothetical protein
MEAGQRAVELKVAVREQTATVIRVEGEPVRRLLELASASQMLRVVSDPGPG